jgi:rhodanese-related sulfurtransferase
MKYIFLSFLASCTLILSAQTVSSVKNHSAGPEPFHINVDLSNAKVLMQTHKNLILIDVRSPEEIALGKIGNAIEMDIKEPDFKEKLAKLDKNKEYMVYCYAGGRSGNAMEIMKEMGFKQVYNFDPGYRAWSHDK